MDFLSHLFDTSDFPARWHCGNWSRGHGWLHILSDLGIWSAYVAIPCVLTYFVLRRKNIPFRSIFLLFGAFILACGTTHLMEAIIFWWPAYRLAGVIKLATAIISWATVLALIPVVPRVLAMRSPEELEREIVARKKAEELLQRTNAELERRVEERTQELKQVVAELRSERELLQTTLTSIGDAVIATDAEARVTFLNPVASALTGWSQEAARGNPLDQVFDIVNESTGQPADNPALRALSQGTIVGLANHTLLIARDGTKRPIDDSAAPIKDQAGTTVGVVLTFRDVTRQRNAERHVREAERRFKAVFNQQFQYMVILSPDGKVEEANDTCFSATGFEREQVLGQRFWDTPWCRQLPAMQAQWQRFIHSAAESAGPVMGEMEYVRASGAIRYGSVVVTGIKDETERVTNVVIEARDDTERKEQEAALRRSEEKFRLLADSISQLAWMARPDGHLFWYNRRWYEYTGTTLEQMEGWGWQAVHDPEILPTVIQRWQESIAEGKPFEMVFPLKGDDQKFRPFLTRVIPLRNEDGEIIYWFGTNTDISAIKEMEEALRASEKQFRQLADAMPQMVWTARADGHIDYYNRRWHEFSGATVDDGNEAWDSIVHPDDRPVSARLWSESLQFGKTFEMEIRLMDRHTRGYRWYLIRTVAVRNTAGEIIRWYGTGTDIHQQKRSGDASRFLANASASLAELVDYESTLQKVAGLAVPFFADWVTVDIALEGALRRVAMAHIDSAKIELAQEVRRRFPADPTAARGALKILQTGKSEMVSEITEAMLVDSVRNQELLAIMRELGLRSYMGVPLKVRGKTLGVMTFLAAESGLLYDAFDLAVAEDLAQRAAIAIENTNLYRELREADRRKDEFLATLAHELRNPLAPIRNSLQILKIPTIDSAVAARITGMMERQVHHLVRLVDDLLDVSRVMRGKIELRKEVVDLATVVARALEMAKPFIEMQGHQLEVALPTESLLLLADPVRMAQVIGNLLTNAAKYTEPNGSIWLSAVREGDQAVLRVRDNGIGIAPEMLTHIFELFVQVDHASTRSQGGLGIGLTLVKNLVEMHQGAVTAHSEGLRHGSEFIVRLPLATVEPGAVNPSEKPENNLNKSSSGHRLMVVDDNRDAAESLAMLLRLQGHEVGVAHNGPAALEMAQASRPEMIFLDIGMPGMDGYEVARRLRQAAGLENVVLTALTGWGQQEDRRRSADAGFDHHLVKPPEPSTLENILATLKLGPTGW